MTTQSRVLVEENANINIKDKYGKILLDYAIEKGNTELIKVLESERKTTAE